MIEEQHRVAQYLNQSTEPKLRAIIEHELCEVHATTLVEVRPRRCHSGGGTLPRMYSPIFYVFSLLVLLCRDPDGEFRLQMHAS